MGLALVFTLCFAAAALTLLLAGCRPPEAPPELLARAFPCGLNSTSSSLLSMSLISRIAIGSMSIGSTLQRVKCSLSALAFTEADTTDRAQQRVDSAIGLPGSSFVVYPPIGELMLFKRSKMRTRTVCSQHAMQFSIEDSKLSCSMAFTVDEQEYAWYAETKSHAMEPAEHTRKKRHRHAIRHTRKWRWHVQEQMQEHNTAWSSAHVEVQPRFVGFEVAEQPIQEAPEAAGGPSISNVHGVKVKSGNGDITQNIIAAASPAAFER